jgi:ABC-type transporter Mla maintaining outer membrane lipid asymmetry ATPase subunit MlaF
MSAIRFTDVVPPLPREGWPGRVSFDVPAGRFTVFATTPGVALDLVRLLAGLRAPDQGTVLVLGVEPGRLGRWETQRFRRRLGVGFDEPSGLVSNLTLHLNLVVPMLYSGLADSRTAHRRARDIIETCGLGRWSEVRPADLPPEVRREAVITRAAVREPELLILEEPTAGLRDTRAGWLLSMCRERSGTVVVTTSEREGVQFEVADQVIILDDAGIEVTHHEVGTV